MIITSYALPAGALPDSALQACLLRVVARLPGTAARLALVLPFIVAPNLLLPRLFLRASEAPSEAEAEAVTIAFAAFLVTWLGSFKALALVGGRGAAVHACVCLQAGACRQPTGAPATPPLPSPLWRPAGPLAMQPWGVLQTWALYAAPLLPAQGGLARGADGPATPRAMALRWALKAAITGALVFFMQLDPPPFIRSISYILGIWSMLGELGLLALLAGSFWCSWPPVLGSLPVLPPPPRTPQLTARALWLVPPQES